MSTNHRPPCIDGSVCGEPAHCPPADRPTTVTDDLRAGIEALCADPFRGYGVDVVRVSDLEALLAAHPAQDEGAEAIVESVLAYCDLGFANPAGGQVLIRAMQ